MGKLNQKVSNLFKSTIFKNHTFFIKLFIPFFFVAKRIIKRAFTPGYQFAKRYLESWSDGTQSSFFKRFYESVQRMDAVHIMQDNVKKAVEVWVDGGNDGNEGIGSNEKNIGRDDDSSDERNEKS